MRNLLKSVNKLIHIVTRWDFDRNMYSSNIFLETVKGVEMTIKYIWETNCFLIQRHVTWYPNMANAIIPWICYCYFPERDSFFIAFCGDIQLPIARVHLLLIYTTRVNFQYLLLLHSPFVSTTYFHSYCFK